MQIMATAKKVGLILLVCAIVFTAHLYVTFVYKRTPEYIHQHVTPIYEQEAEAFFNENHAALMKLVELYTEIKPEKWYTFTFQHHQYDSENMPTEIYTTLLNLEQNNISSDYTISISKESIDIHIGSGTNFDVYLYYGATTWFGMEPEGDKITILEDGWEIHAPYVIRG